MSRCFPFPPPGYERKTKADDTDLLKKEKHREKKHKKEKKDKEKKEKEKKDGKEKREKERSEEKHREKKDKKEKHRDKKKDKDKNRDKDKHKNDLLLSDEKKVVESAEYHVHKAPPDNHVHKASPDNHVHKPSAVNHVHKHSEKTKERESDRNATSAEKRTSGLPAVHNGMPVNKNNRQISENKNFNAPELGRKSMVEERRTTNQLPDKNVSAEKKTDGGVVKLAAKTGGSVQDRKERAEEKHALDGRMDGQGFIGDARSTGSTVVPNSVGLVQNKVGGILRHSEKKIEQKVDGKEKVQEKKGDGRKRDKRKEKDKEKPVNKDLEKEKEEEIMKATTEEKQIQVTRMKNGGESLKPNAKDGNKKDLSGVQSVGFHNTTNDSNHHGAAVNNNIRKRKDIGLNGTYDELVTGPNKVARTTASPHLFSENGRSLEPCQNSAAPSATGIPQPSMDIKVDHNLSYDMQKPPMKIKVDGKDCKINGTVANPSQSSREHTAKAERKSEPPAKSPHPDTKYLDQVFSVPKMDECSDFEDQEWLFSCNSSSTRKPEVKSSGNDETPQVWARAMWLEPVDVYALPYVIPH